MKTSRGIGLLAISLWTGLTGPVWASPPTVGPAAPFRVAQTMEEEKNFFLDTLELILKGQDDAARSLIVEKHELARQTFAFFMRTYPKMPDASQKQLTSKFLNFVAVTFETDLKEKQLVVTLKKKKLWVAGNPKKPVAVEETHMEAVATLESAARLAARFGNFNAQRKLSEAELRLLQKLSKGKPSTAQELAFLNGRLLLASYLAFAGEPSSALALATPLVEAAHAQKSAELEFHLFTYLIYAARQSGQPDLAATYLKGQRDAAARVKTYKGGLFRYLARSWEKAYDSGLSAADYLKASQAALHDLEGYSPEGDILGDGRLFGIATRAWLAGFQTRLRGTELDASARQAMAAQIEMLQGRARGYAELTGSVAGSIDYNPEFTLAWLEFRLDRLRFGEPGRRRSQLTDLAALLQEEEKRIKVLDAVWDKESLHRAEDLKGTDADGALLRFALLDGDFSRIEVAYHRLWEETIAAEVAAAPVVSVSVGDTAAPANLTTGPSASEVELEQHRAAAEKYQDLQVRGQGYQGLQDAGWDRIEWLLSRRPSGWEISADNLAQRALQVNLELQYRPGQIRAYTLLGELHASQNKSLESASNWQKATEFIELEAAQAGAGALAGWERAYEDLAHLYIEQGNALEAWAILARFQEVRALLAFSPPAGSQGDWGKVSERRARTGSLQNELMHVRSGKLELLPAQQELAENEAELAALSLRLTSENRRNEGLLSVQAPSLAPFQKSLPKNAAVIQYVSAPEALFIVILSWSDVKIRRVEIAHGELTTLVTRFREVLRKDATRLSEPITWLDDGSPLYKELGLPYKESASTLHRLLIDPIEGELLDKEVLAFLPGSTLDLPPMAALARLDPAKGLEFLAERKQCVTLMNSSDLEFLNHQVVAPGPAPDPTKPPLPAPVAELGHAFARRLDGNQSRMQMAPDPAGLGVVELSRLRLDSVRALVLSGGASASLNDWLSVITALKAGGARSLLVETGSSAPNPLPDLFGKSAREGKSLGQALQMAQQNLLATPRTAHPSLWSAYTLVGDWR